MAGLFSVEVKRTLHLHWPGRKVNLELTPPKFRRTLAPAITKTSSTMSCLERASTDGHANFTGRNPAMPGPSHTARNWQIQTHPNHPAFL
jgi:hypothetical protein